tara:strand:- start:42 stop:305 length:264 start_codon:yes stop_codon:yes gene_type:complete
MKQFFLIPFLLFNSTYASELSDDEIVKRIISESIMSYPGNCPCPYNRASNGSRCGKRSAYSRSGGYTTICFARDVTPQMIEKYRRRN